MKVSVITPTYNSARYIGGVIDSVLSQTSGFVEHIVVDAGSTDGTIEILRSYPHLKWISEPDSGMYDAINKGIDRASGEIVTYINADDRYFEHTIQTVINTFSANPDLDFVYGYSTYIDEQERTLFVVRPLPYLWAKYTLRILWPQPSWFWKKAVHAQVGLFDCTFKGVGDAEFMRRLVVKGMKGKLVRTPLAKFMLREGSLTFQLGEIFEHERRMCKELYQVDRWSLGRAAGELLYYLQNFTMCLRRLALIRNVSRKNHGMP